MLQYLYHPFAFLVVRIPLFLQFDGRLLPQGREIKLSSPVFHQLSVDFVRFYESRFFKIISKGCLDAPSLFWRERGVILTLPTIAIVAENGAIYRQKIEIFHYLSSTCQRIE